MESSSSRMLVTLPELFQAQAQRTPDAIAVVSGQKTLTYAGLNESANRLAQRLVTQGSGPDRLVGICVERGLDMVVCLLGVLKAGAAYVPLDPSYPADRLAYIVDNSAPTVVITQSWIERPWLRAVVPVIDLDSRSEEITWPPAEERSVTQLGYAERNLAYVIYTSGSTGKPKGVMVEHRSLSNLLTSMREVTRIDRNDRLLAVTTLAFDIAALEIYLPLICGATVVIAGREDAMDPTRLRKLIEESAISMLQATPATWRMLIDSGWAGGASLKALCGGEALSSDLGLKLRSKVGTLWNVYGPTETTVWSTVHEIGDVAIPGQWLSPTQPIGAPIANTRVYALDERLDPVAAGVEGELYIAGDGLARGYFNLPLLTAERFIADPFSSRAGRMYRTGDRVRFRSDGALEFLGRIDDQVKIRGYRIEPAEIEAVLLEHRCVGQAVVIAREDMSGERRLVSYVVVRRESDGQQLIPQLREHLKSRLPEYMVPSAWMVLEELPLTPNGKVDRRALPAPQDRPEELREYVAPRTELERTLASIWAKVLRVEQVGVQDNFFELGGHSLLIVQLMERLREVGLATEVRSIYASPTLADLAHAMTGERVGQFEVPPNLIPPDCEAITPKMLPLLELEPDQIERIAQAVPGGVKNVQDIYPLAPLQEGILFHHLLNGQRGDPYVLNIVLSIPSRKKLEELIQALQAVIDRHDVLRTAVLWEQLPQPVQVVYRRAELPVQELVLNPDKDPISQLKDRMTPEQQRLELRRAPLMRLQVAKDARDVHCHALLQIHHLVCDHESLEILFAEVMAYVAERAPGLPEPVAYRHHVAQALAYDRAHAAESFFRRKLGDVDEPTAPFGLLDVHGDGSRIGEARQELEPELAQRIRTQARRSSVSAATLFHAAWALVVAYTSGRHDVVFGTMLSGRLQGRAGAQRVLGMFINTLPLRLQLPNVSARELVAQTQRELAELLNYEQASLAVAQRCSGIAGSAPLFSTLLNYLHSEPSAAPEQAVLKSEISVLASQERTNYPISLSVDDRAKGFLLTAQVDSRLDPHRTLGYLCTAMQSLVYALEQSPETSALSLTILPEEEWEQLIRLFNATPMIYSQEKLVHELFQEQVCRTPDALAAICGNQQLTYAQLNRMGNKLARALLASGVRPDDRVGVFAERSIELIVGLLGTLKAGCAYVPLDPNNPAERMTYMLRDSAPAIVLVQKNLATSLPRQSVPVMTIDAGCEDLGVEVDDNPSAALLGLRSDHLAYVIYTSGSTGAAKGVMVAHQSVINLVSWHCAAFNIGEGSRCSCVAAVGFDAAAWEIWSALSVGATLTLASPDVSRNVDTLLVWWAAQPLDVSFLPTPLAELALTRGVRPAGLRTLLVGGDRLSYHPTGTSFALINNYGPTESTVIATSGCIKDDDPVNHIGGPVANTQVYILNGNRQPVPIGVSGEIYIGGDGVARGYLHRPGLTAERFIADPFSRKATARMYRTGDLGSWRADGTIEFLGRNDDQVKIRGFRIELGEIESWLTKHEDVEEVVVVAREELPGEKRLVAYVRVSVEGKVSPAMLRAYTKASLPDYMVPSAFVILNALPLTQNGKIDKRALPAPGKGAYASEAYEPPKGEIEETLARIWQELLRIERVGRRDNFFALGGQSLLATRVITRISHLLDIDLPVRVMFETPTIEELRGRIVREIADELSMEEL